MALKERDKSKRSVTMRDEEINQLICVLRLQSKTDSYAKNKTTAAGEFSVQETVN
jgi:hypothetical protein